MGGGPRKTHTRGGNPLKAVVLQTGSRIALEEVPEPQVQERSDVIVRVTTAAICGSDIHIVHGLMPGVPPGTIMGHEFVGIVEKAGPDVTLFQPGDRVAAPAAVWCGTCRFCRRGQVQYCVNGGVWGGGELFGKGLAGVQTALVRVPYAECCLVPIPDSVPDEQAVFVGDVFSTGFHAAREAQIQTGDSVAVFGCGPIGLAALVAAWQFGPRRVFGIDVLDNRLALAEHYGATAIDARETNVVERLRSMTAGDGVDVAVEAAGTQDTMMAALRSVRRGGAVSVVGIFPQPMTVPLNELVPYGLRISMGLGNLGRMRELMGLIEEKRVDLAPFVTHTFALDEAQAAYELFEHRKDACVKVLLKP